MFLGKKITFFLHLSTSSEDVLCIITMICLQKNNINTIWILMGNKSDNKNKITKSNKKTKMLFICLMWHFNNSATTSYDL